MAQTLEVRWSRNYRTLGSELVSVWKRRRSGFGALLLSSIPLSSSHRTEFSSYKRLRLIRRCAFLIVEGILPDFLEKSRGWEKDGEKHLSLPVTTVSSLTQLEQAAPWPLLTTFARRFFRVLVFPVFNVLSSRIVHERENDTWWRDTFPLLRSREEKFRDVRAPLEREERRKERRRRRRKKGF